VLLGRLRIRSRLALLILVPLIAALIQTIAAATAFNDRATRAADTARRVEAGSQVAALMTAMEQERLTAVGLLLKQVDRREFLLAEATTQDAVTAVSQLGLPTVDTNLPTLGHLVELRQGILAGMIRPVDVIIAYSQIAISVLDSVRLIDAVDGDTPQGQGATALDGIMRGLEGYTAVMASMIAGRTPDIKLAYVDGLGLLLEGGSRFNLYATPDQVAIFGIAQQAVNNRLGPGFNDAMVSTPSASIHILDTPPSYRDVAGLSNGVGLYLESKVINDTLATANAAQQRAQTQVALFVGLSIVLILIAILLAYAVARSVAIPVRRLTRSADSVATLAESELVRVADDDTGDPDPVRLRPIAVAGRDEIADFARAFSRVQETAARLVERQVASRRNVALMLGHVGRRTQNLVGRQISLIDRLEAQESEPDRLGDLYRLDHISSRLRRNASSLVVISGTSDAGEHITPVALDEVVRIGLAEIEDYTRVDVRVPPTVHVGPALVNDLVLLLAELMENATGFSPPGTRVGVSALPIPHGLRIQVIDHGIGMTQERIVEENARLTHRERLDLAPTEVLGLFVVGRLARRHGLSVWLAETPGGGVTAAVDVPARLLLGGPAPAAPARTGRRTPVAAGVRAAIEQSPQEQDLLSRASVSMREIQPWNAFATRPALPAGDWPKPVVPRESSWSATPPPMYPPAFSVPAQGRAIVAGSPRPVIPRPRVEPDFAGVAAGYAEPRSSTLARRVPGASLQALEGAGPAAPSPSQATRPASADEVRDSLAQFEFGIARAEREAQQGDRR
jgi:signal transduction histidine kinase